MSENKPVVVVIYKITSPSNKVYIGQSWDWSRRLREYQFINNSSQQAKLYSSFKKYGVTNHTFEVIHELPKDILQSTLDRYEQLYMDLYRDCNINLLNLRGAGSRGKHSKETREKMSKSRKGIKYSEETIRKMSEGRKGKCLGKNNPMFGKIYDEEKRAYMGSLNKGRKQSVELLQKRFKEKLKIVLQLSKDREFIKEWVSAEEAARELKLIANTIRRHCNTIGKSHLRKGDFIWEYKK